MRSGPKIADPWCEIVFAGLITISQRCGIMKTPCEMISHACEIVMTRPESISQPCGIVMTPCGMISHACGIVRTQPKSISQRCETIQERVALPAASVSERFAPRVEPLADARGLVLR